ncbi:MAG: UBP-type zinc finger domain-containing protein [Hymenobacter sp.]
MSTTCQHLARINHIIPDAQHVCPERVALGDDWMHLRTCQDCGHVGCRDDSKNKHATKHFRATQHPVIASAHARRAVAHGAHARRARWHTRAAQREPMDQREGHQVKQFALRTYICLRK